VVAECYLFMRFSVFNFTAMLPILGAVTVHPSLLWHQILGLVLVALAFHTFAYLLNDIVDLPIDRTESLRQDSPLVRGTVQLRYALGIVHVQIPIAILGTLWLDGGLAAYSCLMAAFLLATIYDLWGKRCPFPPITDAVLALACCAFMLYGTFVTGRSPTLLTAALVNFVFIFALMINGIHGALKDLGNDFRTGASTTAIFLGARPTQRGLVLPFSLIVYTCLLQSALLILMFLPLFYDLGHYEYGGVARLWTAVTMACCGATSFILLFLSAKSSKTRCNMIMFGILHLFLSLGSLVILLGSLVAPRILGTLLVLYLFPIATMWYLHGFRWSEA
jgi:4-hydroxybenzoate polyprenyltransferase